MGVFNKIFGDESSKFIKGAGGVVAEINALEEDISKLKDSDFPSKTNEFKARLKEGKSLDDILPEAFAVVREASKRNLGERHYDVQLILCLSLHIIKIS